MRKISVREVLKPPCACGGPTRLARVERHPVYGTGYELRTFVCERCRSETTTETSPGTISLSSDASPPPRRSIWSRLTGR